MILFKYDLSIFKILEPKYKYYLVKSRIFKTLIKMLLLKSINYQEKNKIVSFVIQIVSKLPITKI